MLNNLTDNLPVGLLGKPLVVDAKSFDLFSTGLKSIDKFEVIVLSFDVLLSLLISLR